MSPTLFLKPAFIYRSNICTNCTQHQKLYMSQIVGHWTQSVHRSDEPDQVQDQVWRIFHSTLPQKLPGPPPHPACERSGHSAVVGGTGNSNKTPWLADFSWRLFRKSYRDLLPTRPVSDLVILPWWVVQVRVIRPHGWRIFHGAYSAKATGTSSPPGL
jgi:hypothetical protein